MADYDYLIPNEGKATLRSLRGKTLECIEGYRMTLLDGEGDRVTFHSVARLHLEGGDAFDLRIESVHVDIAEGFWDDVGAYSFVRADGGIWLPEGVKAFKMPISRRLDDVFLVNDYDKLMCGGTLAGSFAFTKAVMLRTGLELLALSMDDFCEDAIVVRRGFDAEELVPDGSGGWYDEPGWTDEYSRECVPA